MRGHDQSVDILTSAIDSCAYMGYAVSLAHVMPLNFG